MSLSEIPARKTFLEHADDVASTVAGPGARYGRSGR